MKTRNGFVSNSSSSSFICCVAKIADKEKAHAWIEKFTLDKYDYKVQKVKDIENDTYSDYAYIDGKGNVTVESFQTSVNISEDKLKPEDEILSINIMNDEGDSQFYIDDYDLDYDIDLDFFDDNQIEIYTGLTKENGFEMIEKTYGAGRNG